MTDEHELRILRRAYAKRVLAAARVEDARLEEAFATIPREDYLGAGPWPILRFGIGYVQTPEADPLYLYDDVLVGLRPERGLNNGMPSYHVQAIAAAEPREGEHVVHVGAGTGYYSAILAQLVGPAGRVTAIELDPELAARAAANLGAFPQARVVQGNGASLALDPADVVYVNGGATRPAEPWLDALREGGRLMLPLTARKVLGPGPASVVRHGAVFRIRRSGGDYHARWVSPVAVYPCDGFRDAVSEKALAAALEGGGVHRVTRLHRRGDLPPQRCWLRGPDWCLAYD